MKVLVTGSSGTIGTRLCETLIARKHDVIGADWVKNKWNESINAITTNIDLREREAAAKLPKADAIVHLAANARVYELVENPERAFDNFMTLFNTLEYARKNGVKKIIFASSRESYGNAKQDRYAEDMVRVENCESPYTASKVGGEALVHAYARCYGIDAAIVRFSNVYGMYDDSIRVVPLFMRLSKKNEPLTIFGKDKCLDFTYIDDAVDGVVRIIEKFDDAKVKNNTFNLAYGEGRTIIELAEMIKKANNSTSPITIGESRTGEVITYVADITKARSILGFDPKTNLDEGIKKAAQWYAEHT